MKTTTRTVVILIVSETRESPSSTFPAAADIDAEGETIEEARPGLAKCWPSRERQKLARSR
jgi:hypothetical protein